MRVLPPASFLLPPSPTPWRAPHSRPLVLLSALLVAGALGCLTIDARYPWLWAYLGERVHPQMAQAAGGPTHVIFTFVDHFEPHDEATMDRWMAGYPAMARRHRDADGRMPQHSWFWFFSQSDGAESLQFLQQLARLAYDGFGEVELHFHHDSDTEASLREKLQTAIQLSQWTGALITAEPHPRRAFGFIHGLWALDNSRHGAACGVNNEITLLRQLGCYADFTHPSWGPMHPRTVNRFYYVTDDPTRPKSYDRGVSMHVGGRAVGDLLLMEGPSVVRWRGWRPVYDHGNVTVDEPPTQERVDAWVKAGVHVEGRPEWVFVRVYTHGALAQDHEAVLGAWADRLHEALQRYNDGTRYVLHYATAREAYNMAKAAEAGRMGTPNAYRDFVLSPYANRLITASVPFDVLSTDGARLTVRLLTPAGTRATVRVRSRQVNVLGDAEVIEADTSAGDTALILAVADEGVVTFDLQPRALASERWRLEVRDWALQATN